MPTEESERAVRRLRTATDGVYAWIEAPEAEATDEAFDQLHAEFHDALHEALRCFRSIAGEGAEPNAQ